MSVAWRGLPDRRIAAAAWACTAIVLALGAGFGAQSELSFRSRQVRAMQVQADVLADGVSAALAFDDRAAMRQDLHAVLLNPQVEAAAVYDSRKRRVEAVRDPRAAPAPELFGDRASGYIDDRAVAASQVSEQGQSLGWVLLRGPPDSFGKFWGRHTGLLLLLLLAMLLLTLATRAASRLTQANQSLRDEIEARERAEQALLQSQKMEALGQLTGGIAHDFNNLLQAIHGAFELIRMRPGDIEKVRLWAAQGLAGAERGTALTRQLLAFSRSQRLELRPFAVSDLVRGMREFLTSTVGSTIEVSLETPDEPLIVLSDRTQLELALLNLAINARDAMPRGGRLTVSVSAAGIPPGDPVLAEGAYAELAVADTGSGMSAEVLGRAIEPFFTTKGAGRGTGLGLSQVYGVARQALGDVRITSAPGKGTVVRILLPLTSANAAAEPEPAPAEPPAGPAAGRVVLVVDDDDQVRGLTGETLRALGYEVLEAASGQAALDVLARTRPSVVLLDYAMPGLNGAETAQRALERWPDLPIVLASGYADTQAVAAALGEDAVMLRKPFDVGALGAAIDDALRRAQAAPHPEPG